MILKPFIDQAFVANLAGCWYMYILCISVDLSFILAHLNIREKKKINLPPWSFMLLVVTVQCYVRVSFVLNLFLSFLCQEQIEYHLEEERLKSKEALKKAVEVLKMTEI